MSKENEYQRLMDISINANTNLRRWKEKCATVYLDGCTHDFELRHLHELLSNHFPEVVQSRRISDGGSNKMTLIAPVDDITSALSLVVDSHAGIKAKYSHRIEEIINTLKVDDTIKLDPDYR